MKKVIIAVLITGLMYSAVTGAQVQKDIFATPVRGFISQQPAEDWQHGLLTGNGTMGAIVLGNPYDETLFLSHASLHLPLPKSKYLMEMNSRLGEVRKLCLEGNYMAAGRLIDTSRQEASYHDSRDPFIAAFNVRIKQSASTVKRYQRSVDFMTAEAKVSVEDHKGTFQQSTFISRCDDVIVVRLTSPDKLTVELSFESLGPGNDREKAIVAEGVKSSHQGVKDGLLYYRTLFTNTNKYNPDIGYEGVGKVVTKGGSCIKAETGIHVVDADEILVLIKIQPLLKSDGKMSNLSQLGRVLDNLTPDYDTLLKSHAKKHGDFMGRVSLTLNVPAAECVKSNEDLITDSETLDAPLALIQRAFDAGRYNIICSTGWNPPNLQGLWSGTWLAPWSGSFTVNGNLQCAVAFLLMGNTPELMHAYFRHHDKRWAGYRENAKAFFGTRGFHIPAQQTVSPLSTNFHYKYPHCYWHSGAAWACQAYYDYYQYTGDRAFLAERAYPIMKEAAAFYEDFLISPGTEGQLAFIPSYSPENRPGKSKGGPTTINATMDISAAKQLLRNTISAAKLLGRDTDLQKTWVELISRLPDYEVGPDGSFREWLWPGLHDNNGHRHASHLYALYDDMPNEIINDPKLVNAVEHTINKRMDNQRKAGVMAFGTVQLGLAAEHVGNTALTQEIINFLTKGYWTSGMGSFHNNNEIFNMDISGGFPYLCASALVYADPGHIRFFPARPDQWKSGSLKGVRLRGGIVVRELTWSGDTTKAILVSNTNQTVTIESPTGTKVQVLRAGQETVIVLQ